MPQWSDERQARAEAYTRVLDRVPGGDTSINAPCVEAAASIMWGQRVVNPVKQAAEDVISCPGQVKRDLDRGWQELNNPHNWINFFGSGGY